MNETKSKFKTFLSTGCLVLTLGVLTINFQNCSGLSSADYGSDGESVSQGEDGLLTIGDTSVFPTIPTVTVEASGLTASFLAGDTFSGQTLVSSGSFLDSLIQVLQYQSYSGGKAIAMAENGLGYAAVTGGADSEAERMAVETCNFLSGKNCALVVSGNYFVAASDKVFEGADYILKNLTGSNFDRNEIPMARALVRNSSVVTSYINASGNKALAISPTGGVYSVFSTGSITSGEVKRMALQRCEMESAITPCAIYAENTTVSFNPDVFAKKSSLSFSGNDVRALAPPGSRESSLYYIKTFLYDIERAKYAIYITPNGYGYFGTHATDVDEARSSALSQCESGVHGSRCIPYASSAGLNFSVDHIKAKANYSGLFCKSVRYSCSEHLNMGCAQGQQYWVQNPATMEAELTVCGN